MRAYEFIFEELEESPGFDASGPSGVNYPRGFNLQAMGGGMYNMRPSKRKYFNRYPEEILPGDHIKAIDDRMEGGMSFDNAIQARAKEVKITTKELKIIYRKEKI